MTGTKIDEIARGKVLKLRELNAATLERILELTRYENNLEMKIANLEKHIEVLKIKSNTIEKLLESSLDAYEVKYREYQTSISKFMESEKTMLQSIIYDFDENLRDGKGVWGEELRRAQANWDKLKLESQKNYLLTNFLLYILACKLPSLDEVLAFRRIGFKFSKVLQEAKDIEIIKSLNKGDLADVMTFFLDALPSLMDDFKVFDPEEQIVKQKHRQTGEEWKSK